MVEGVVCLPAQREIAPFAFQRKTLGEREVYVVDAGIAHAILGGIAGIALAGDGECRGVEPGVECRAVGVGIAHYIDALSIPAAGEVGALDGAEADGCRRSTDPLR